MKLTVRRKYKKTAFGIIASVIIAACSMCTISCAGLSDIILLSALILLSPTPVPPEPVNTSKAPMPAPAPTPAPYNVAVTAASSTNKSAPSFIAARKTAENIRDVNRDGLINCIDRALLYKQYYGDGTQARLIWNKNDTANLNHLFVYIPDGAGGWIAIEPSYTSEDIARRTMSYAWGSQYNPRYDRDVTASYNAIKAGTFNWAW